MIVLFILLFYWISIKPSRDTFHEMVGHINLIK